MISLKQFCRLKHGSQVWWGSRTRGFLRTCLYGPADRDQSVRGVEPGMRHVGFAIRHRSWTGKAHTSYGFNDVKRVISPTKRRIQTVISEAEAQHLRDHGFNVREQYAQELRESNARNKRMGRDCPFTPLPLPKSELKKLWTP
jgi:hypothetical protein